ncbi:hypothetical protein JST56_03805 [Candidatus Dependentiae bacterium]|jgi:hypothetical protein|nr:hypothetical protein [Candidatus Dependentiae bacterium]
MFTLWRLALFFQVFHLVYHQVTTIFDLYPFNNIKSYTRKQQLLECGSCAFAMGIPIFATLFGGKIMAGVSVVLFILLLMGEYFTWWKPYFFGPTELWKTVYNKKFKSTIIILPAINDHPIPNLEHLILHSITVVTFILTVKYFFALL